MYQVPARDWKILAASRTVFLNRLCARFNAETQAILHSAEGDDYERYIKVYKHIRDADDVVASIFDDWKRSRFHQILATLIDSKVAGAEIKGMSQETRLLMNKLYGIDLGIWDCPF